MRRWAFAPVSLAIALAIRAATPILIAQSPGTDPVIELTGATDGVRERMTAAARLATSRFTEWLGPPPFDRISIGGGAPRPADSPGQMRVEALVAEELARAWLARINGHDQWKEGVVTYLQSRVVEEMFDRTFLLRAYRYDGDCFFGCLVSWSFRGLPLSRFTAETGPVAIAFASLERELGWPTLQGALRVAVSSKDDPVVAMSSATGRNLAAVFDAALTGTIIDHELSSFESAATTCASPCYRTQVSIKRGGAVPFPLDLRLVFADGQILNTRWDGQRSRLEFESSSPVVEAHLDPDRVLLLDANPLNNAIIQPRDTNVPIAKWMARWIVWLQDAILTHTFPV